MADVPASESWAAGAEPSSVDWDAAIPAEAADRLDSALSRFLRRALRGLFVGSVLGVLLTLMITLSAAVGWLLVWLPTETYQLASSGRFSAGAFAHDFGAALAQIASAVQNLLG